MISWLLLGALFQLDPVASEREWRQELVATPTAFAPLFNLGFLCFNTGRFAEAEPLLRRAAAANPKDFNTHYVHGMVLQRLDRRDEALRSWRRALALRPDHVRLMKVMSVEYTAGRYFTEAAGLARRVVELEPADDQGWLLAIKALVEAQQYAAAYTLGQQAQAKFPANPRVAFELAFLLHRQGRWADAAPLLEAAMQADPNYEEPWYLYGDVLLKQEQPAKAIPFFEKAIALRPEYLPARMALARAFMSLEQWEKAIEQLAAAAQVRPDDPQPPLLLSQVLFRLGDEAAARQAKEKSLLLRRANPAAQEALQNRAFRP